MTTTPLPQPTINTLQQQISSKRNQCTMVINFEARYNQPDDRRRMFTQQIRPTADKRPPQGFTMGVRDGAKILRPVKNYTHNLKFIRAMMRHSYPMDGDSHPVVLVDTSIYLVQALKRKEALSQYFILPPVPVTAVADALADICNLLVDHKFRPCLVLDGASYPPKQATSEKRYGNRPEDIRKLDSMYERGANDDEEVTKETILEQQKKVVSVRPDVLYEIVQMAQANGFLVLGAPFEADSQIVSLLNQGIGDFALTNDSDLPYQGASFTIMRLSLKGNCCLVSRTTVLQTFKEKLKAGRQITVNDLAIFAAICGNDYVERLQGHGAAYAEAFMREYVQLRTSTAAQEFIDTHVKKLPSQEQSKFLVSLYTWEHAPAFRVVPTLPTDSPREAFDKGSSHYQVILGSMTSGAIDEAAWQEGLGFDVDQKLRAKHVEQIRATFHDMFTLQVWSRTGLKLEPVPPLLNEEGYELLQYAIIDFDSRPARLLDPTVLRTYLLARAISVPNEDYDKLLSKVEEVAKSPNMPLPKFLFRGNGGYREYQVLSPRDEVAVDWLKGDEVLDKIRNVLPRVSDDWFTGRFGVRNASRYRCLKHLKGGSYDINDLQFTDLFKNDLQPEKEVVIVRATCAPSQKLGGGDLYTLSCVFQRSSSDEEYEYVDHPLSSCTCYNGHTVDAHKGGLLLLFFLLQQRPHWDFEKCVNMLPDSIHDVASKAIFVSYAYPPLQSKEAKADKAVREETLRAARLVLADGEDNSSDESDGEGDEMEVEIEIGADDIEASEVGANETGEDVNEPDIEIDADVRWANPLMDCQVRDVGSAPPFPVCANVLRWVLELEASKRVTGDSRKLASRRLLDEGAKRASKNSSPEYRKRQLNRLLRFQAMTEKRPELRRNLASHYSADKKIKVQQQAEQMEGINGVFQRRTIYKSYR